MHDYRHLVYASFAVADFNSFLAFFALHVATPEELALTPIDFAHNLWGVTPLTTHQVTAVHRLRRAVTQAAFRSQGSSSWVRLAEVRGLVHIDEVVLGVWLEFLIDWNKDSTGSDLLPCYPSGAVEFFFQVIAYFSEKGQRSPACLHVAWAGDAMTLALVFHVDLHRLKNGNGKLPKRVCFQ